MVLKIWVHVDRDLRRRDWEWEVEVGGGRRFNRGVARVVRHERGNVTGEDFARRLTPLVVSFCDDDGYRALTAAL